MGDILDRGEDRGLMALAHHHHHHQQHLRAGGGGVGGGEDGDGTEFDGALKQEFSVLLERDEDEDDLWQQEEYLLQGPGGGMPNVIYYDDLLEEAGGVPEEDFPFDDEQGGAAWIGLDMSRVGLSVISPELSFYPNLTSLYLNNNKFTEMPAALFQLTRLIRLDLSCNAIQKIPPEIGRLIRLEELSFFRNKIRELPVEMGRLYRLKLLQLDGNPITSPPFTLIKQGAEAVVMHLRDRMPLPAPPPTRLWLEIPRRSEMPLDDESSTRIRVLCYNILAEKYAIPELLSYCPSQYLKWNYRRTKILEEILSYDSDFLALQEVEAGHYKQFFEPEMAKAGYAGMFKPKSRARTMGDWTTVDGCVLFYKPDKFELLDEFWIEYQSSSIKRYEKEFPSSAQALDRLISKDQIAIAAVFRCKNTSSSNKDGTSGQENASESNGQENGNGKTAGNHADGGGQGGKSNTSEDDPLIMIVNTHIHWDPAFADVKLMQVCMLLEELETITTPLSPSEAAIVAKYGIGEQGILVDTFTAGLTNDTAKKIMTKRYPGVPMLICGDFNSMPDSGVYEYIRKGQISGGHGDFGGYDYGRYSRVGPRHPFRLSSAYEEIAEPTFTNYTDGFVGCLDYMFYSSNHFEVAKLLQPVDESTIFDQTGALPNAYMCSDHICLVSEFKMKKLTKKDREREAKERERDRAERTATRNAAPAGGSGGGGGSGIGSAFFQLRDRGNGQQPKRDF